MSENLVMHEIFTEFQNHLDSEQEAREDVRLICRDTDRLSRELCTILQIIHYSEESIGPACLKARELFIKANEGYQKLKDAIPKEKYFKFYDHWRNMTQRYCFLISLTIWLEAGFMVRHETVAEILGIDASEEDGGFHLDLEDYLIGILMLCTELSRFAVNSASRGEYCRTIQISKFVIEINAGFRLLNLKNDNLRKRYDALKYDVKKIEDIVYDLSLRGLFENETEQDADNNEITDAGDIKKTDHVTGDRETTDPVGCDSKKTDQVTGDRETTDPVGCDSEKTDQVTGDRETTDPVGCDSEKTDQVTDDSEEKDQVADDGEKLSKKTNM